MARKWLLALGLLTVAFTVGCNREDRILSGDNRPFRVENVYSVTGDVEVTIYWRENQESDIDYYKVYRNDAPTGTFALIGTATHPPFVDTQVVNGETYFYAVAAVDDAGHESADLSHENVFDTPRPEGGATLTDANTVAATSGWDFSAMTRRPSTDLLTDIYYDASSGFLVYTATGVKIQDAGYIELVDVDFGPPSTDGWSTDGIVEAIPGHSYIVLTADGHYAKFEVVTRGAANMVIDWAYQIDPNNPELAPKLARKQP